MNELKYAIYFFGAMAVCIVLLVIFIKRIKKDSDPL